MVYYSRIMKILIILLTLTSINLSYAQENEGFIFKFLNDFGSQNVSLRNKTKTFISNKVLVGVQANADEHYVSLLYGQEYIQGFDAKDSMRLGYAYKMSSSFMFKFYANFGYDLYFYEKVNRQDSTLINTATLIPQIAYFLKPTTSFMVGLVGQLPSEMDVKGLNGYTPINPKFGFGYTLGINHYQKLSERLCLELGASFLKTHRSTKTIGHQVNEQLHGIVSFTYKID